MSAPPFRIAASFIILLVVQSSSFALGDSLRARIEREIGRATGHIGVALRVIETGDTLSINGQDRFPMQSVYKFPLALAVLSKVDTGTLSLDQRIHVAPDDLRPNTWSPLRDRYSHGDVDITVDELLAYTVPQSDNNGCDILFRLLGGPPAVDRYIHGLGIDSMSIVATEAEMHAGWEVQYRNWSSPAAMTELLSMFYRGRILSVKGTEYLWRLMAQSTTGPGRLRALLPAGTVVAHKTGSSGTNAAGIAAAVNDVGIIALPNGRHVAISVFVSNSTSEEKEREKIIAEVARAVWDSFTAR